jgi:hypothetical protein
MNGYLLFGRLDTAAGDMLLSLVGPAGPLRAAALGATGGPGAIAAYDAASIVDARARADRVAAAGVIPTEHLAYAGHWEPAGPVSSRAGGTGGKVTPMRVFGLPVAADGHLSVTFLAVPPLALDTALAAAAESGAAVSPVTGGRWNLLVEHVAGTVADVQKGIDGLFTSLRSRGAEVTAATTLYSSHALFRTTNPNTPPPV